MPAMGSVAEYAGAEGGLLERSAFLEALEEGFDDVAAGGGRLVLVSGEAGIGKSTLVRRFCETRDAGTRVLWGACDALGTPRPLGPLVDMAATLEGAFPDSVHEGEKPHAVFVALLEEVRARAADDRRDRGRALGRRGDARRRSPGGAAGRDARCARPDHLSRETSSKRRTRCASPSGSSAPLPGSSQLRLPPLSRDAVEELARPHGVDAEELYVKTAGNPFFVTEVLAGGGTEVPPTVRDAVLGRMSRLGAAAQGVLEAVAVVPPHVEMWLLDEVVPDEVVHVDACLATGMLRGEGRTVSFRHELARLAVEQSIGPHRRVLLHRRILEALRNPPEGALPDPAQLAYHAEAAGNARAVLQHATAAGHAGGLAGSAPRGSRPVRARPALRREL